MLTMLLHKMSREHLEAHLTKANLGINSLQCGILHMLRAREQTITELSRKFVLDPSTLVPVIDSLERKGLVVRSKDPNDRRRVPLSITEQGGRLLDQLPMIDLNDPVLLSLGSLGEERTKLLLEILRDLLKGIPEGETMLEEVSERIKAQYGTVNTPRP